LSEPLACGLRSSSVALPAFADWRLFSLYTVEVSGAVASSDAPVDAASLLQAIAERQDRDAFVALFRMFAPKVKSYLIGLGASAAQADDLIQDVMLTVWNKAAQFDPRRSSPATWIFTIARNRRIDVLRRERRYEYDSDDPMLVEDPAPSGFAAAAARQDEVKVAQAMEQLTADQVAVVRLAFFEDKTHREIATQLNVPIGTVKSRMFLAFEKLRGRRARAESS